jgi:hypothetical protein
MMALSPEGELLHTHDKSIVGSGRALALRSPVRDCKLRVVVEIRIPVYDLLARDLELAVLSVIEGTVY